ncbi:MAG: ShlB/FhaC/HecB family hemolysin secretion/activation protein [Burkholderiales bacterium]|nr:ShlB/FhaC/HecB family hemolysin secretion/activation protein [Burkholderiales bacterium]
MHLPYRAVVPWISLLSIAISQAALAQQPPTAGSQLQQIPAQPTVQTSKPDLQVSSELPPAAVQGDGAKVVVNGLQFAGASAIDEAELVRVSGFMAGSQYTVAELRAMAAKITAHYRSLGHFVAQTYLPTQDITDGIVRFTVLEGQYGQIKLRNQSNLADSVANHLLDGLKSADKVTTNALERRLLMLSDLPGILVKSRLAPASERGATDLTVEITPGQGVSGSVEADNQGNRYTGANRIGASININEPTGLGDVAAFRVLTSGEGLVFGRVSYQLQAGQIKLGGAYTTMRYVLGEEFASSQSSGTARVTGLYANYPLVRSRNSNLALQWSLDNKDFSDRLEASLPGVSVDKNALLSTLSLNGDRRDASGTGLSTFTLSWTRGRLDLQNDVFLANDSSSAQSNGTYDKVAYGLTRQQTLFTGTDLYVSVNGQWSSKNLDASEKFSLGGGTGVRAYPAGEASGDQGAILTLETRTNFSGSFNRLPGQLQWIGFIDIGSVSVNRSPWDAVSTNSRELRGAGLGLNWIGPSNMFMKAYWAFKLGDAVATSAPDASGRFWLQLIKAF